jgi:hypothetical protein
MIIVVIHLQLLNNNLERGMMLVLPVTLFFLFYGMVSATFEGVELTSYTVQIFITLSFGTLAFCIFMYLQKRVHKEVFMGMKNRMHQQNEFKTIFD